MEILSLFTARFHTRFPINSYLMKTVSNQFISSLFWWFLQCFEGQKSQTVVFIYSSFFFDEVTDSLSHQIVHRLEFFYRLFIFLSKLFQWLSLKQRCSIASISWGNRQSFFKWKPLLGVDYNRTDTFSYHLLSQEVLTTFDNARTIKVRVFFNSIFSLFKSIDKCGSKFYSWRSPVFA